MTPTDPTPRDVLAVALARTLPSPMHDQAGHDEWRLSKADATLAALAAFGWSLTRSEPDPLDVERLARALVKWGGALHTAKVVTLYDEGRVAAAAIARAYAEETP